MLRGLVAAVALSALAWAGLDALGAGPFVGSLMALLAYCALLAGSAPQRAHGRQRGETRRGAAHGHPEPSGARHVAAGPDVERERVRPREVVLDDHVAHGA